MENILYIVLMFASVVWGVHVANQEYDEGQKQSTK